MKRMPQRKQIRWAELRVGLLVITSLVALAVGIFLISGQIGLFSPKYRVNTYFSSVQGLKVGAPVRLAGVSVGNVESVALSPYPEPERAIEVTLRIARQFQSDVRSDSMAALQSEGLLGDRYVEISRGTPKGSILPDGGQLPGQPSSDIKQIMSNTNDVLSNLRDLSSNLRDITQKIEKGQGSLGKLLSDPTFYNRLGQMAQSAERIVVRIEKGEGSAGKFLSDDAFYRKITSSANRLDRVLDKIESGEGTLAKLINDPGVYDNVNRLLVQANTVVGRINQGEGTVGKLMTDPSLYNRMDRTFEGLSTVARRMERGEGTLGSLSTDDSLFQNLNSATEELKTFAQDFRRDPKKYLRLKFGLF
jgi:phospholipid/cholesterol/gamma-HCH transport system substrate-binding protein